MVVISDTTTITNLIQINLLDILPKLYNEVIIPLAVHKELLRFEEQKTIINSSNWLKPLEVENNPYLGSLLESIDKGEAEAIALAIKLQPDFLIIDERAGRKIAKEYGIPIIGLLGILMLAKQQGLIENVKTPLDSLKDEVGFRVSKSLYEFVLSEVNER
ncbi:MAG: DUF3368 domain-containing protein [Phaeodactylibacter xiamenensis]|uniref:DUF3368 domain-containing protein n=1 Tax=Phaeodactylibacter xiamenensis TaxID=1524460 RepID=A0A098S8V1_9BACT|nr:DUF3368 domain-containing protein [Phaeodactylibacter xiamenensis]KGE88536.1 hypothetical protein IX84_07590 [Phaeodactylibacter xiamenensis]MCR9054415.1 DUF3368 domain-containing protein [bacterium]